VASFGSFVEVEVVGSIEQVDTIEYVLACMRMNYVQENGEAHSVRGIDEFLELLGCAISGGCSEERGD
jgi:hypothetical protein